MYQQINMYQPVFRRQRKIFSAATLLKIVVMATLLLLTLYGQARWTLNGLQRTSDDLAQNFQQLDTRLGALEAGGEPAANTTLGNEIAMLEAQITAREELLNRIDRLVINTTAGFGDNFETLARQHVPGLWLTGIRLDQHGNTELRGTTLDPKLVPRYLQMLAGHTRLAALNGGSVNLTRHAPDKPEVDFVLRYDSQGSVH